MEQKIISAEELSAEPYASMAGKVQGALQTAAHLFMEEGIAEDVLAYLSGNTDRFYDDMDFGMLLGSMIQEKADIRWYEFVLGQYGGWAETSRAYYAESVVLAIQHGMPPMELEKKMSSCSDVYEIFEFADSYGTAEQGKKNEPDGGSEEARGTAADRPDSPDAGYCPVNAEESREDGMDEAEDKRQEQKEKNRESGEECQSLEVSARTEDRSRYAGADADGGTGVFLKYMDAVVGERRDDTKAINLLREAFGQAQKYLNEYSELRRVEAERVKSLERVNTVQTDRIRNLTERICLLQQENLNLRKRLNEAARNEKINENIAHKLREITSMQESVMRPDFGGFLTAGGETAGRTDGGGLW